MLDCWGARDIHFRGSKSTISSIIHQSSFTTIPIIIDDVSSAAFMEEVSVHLTGGASHSTLRTGTSTPRTSIIATANYHFGESDRYVENAITIL